MSATKNNLHEEQSIRKTVFNFFTSLLPGKSAPSCTTQRQLGTDQTERHGNKHRHHHHRHGPHECDREETQGFEYPLNCKISADAGFWEKAHNLQAEAVLQKPPQVTVRSSNRLLADLSGSIDALAPRKTPTTSGSHRTRRHRGHHSSAQNQDPIQKPPQATVSRGENGVFEKRTKNVVKDPSLAAHNQPSGLGSHRRRRHHEQRCPEVIPNIPPIINIKVRISPNADRRDPVQDIHPTLRNPQVTGSSQPPAISSRSKYNQTHALPLESRRGKAPVNLGKLPTRDEVSQISTTATSKLVESTMSNLSSSTIRESYRQEIPPRQNVLRHQGVQIMHPPRREWWAHSQEATTINPGMSDRDSAQTRLGDFMPRPLKIDSSRTAAKSVLEASSRSDPSTPAILPSPRPKARFLLGVVDDGANRESRSSSGRTPPLNQKTHESSQSNRSNPIRQNRGSAPASYWEDLFPIQASSNEAWPSSNDYNQGSQKFCKICNKPCVQDRRISEVVHILCPTCEARAFIQPYPTIAKMVDHPGSQVGSPASFDKPRRTSGGSAPGSWMRGRGRDTPTSPTLYEGEELQMPPPMALKTRSSPRPRFKDVGPSNLPRGRQVIPLTPPSSSGSPHSRLKDVGSFPQYRTAWVLPPGSPSPSPPVSERPRQGDNPNFPRGGRLRPPIPKATSERLIPNSSTPNTTTSSIVQKTHRLQPHDNNHLTSSSRANPSSRPSMADSYITCTDNDYEIPKFIPFILDDGAGLGIDLSGNEQAARSTRSPSSPMENRERNLVGRYQNKWDLPYSLSMMANEDRNEGVDRPTWYYRHYDGLLGENPGGDPRGGDDSKKKKK